MSDDRGRIVGIRLRTDDGFKFAIKGSSQGLFIPRDLDVTERLLIAEGPTDTAALLDLGIPAVGRPSCTGGSRQIARLIRRLNVCDVVIVADADPPGQRGACALASVLKVYARSVRIIQPPPPLKDARAWKASCSEPGQVAEAIGRAIDAVPVERIIPRSRGRSH